MHLEPAHAAAVPKRVIGLEHRPIPAHAIRSLIHAALASARLADATGKPLNFVPHDFRRIFATSFMNGMPPHIAQLILGHRDINTTMAYKNPRELHQTGAFSLVA